VNENTNHRAHKQAAMYDVQVPYVFASRLKILIPVGKGKVHRCTGTEALYRLYGP